VPDFYFYRREMRDFLRFHPQKRISKSPLNIVSDVELTIIGCRQLFKVLSSGLYFLCNINILYALKLWQGVFLYYAVSKECEWSVLSTEKNKRKCEEQWLPLD
jgi:hypothetical protein